MSKYRCSSLHAACHGIIVDLDSLRDRLSRQIGLRKEEEEEEIQEEENGREQIIIQAPQQQQQQPQSLPPAAEEEEGMEEKRKQKTESPPAIKHSPAITTTIIRPSLIFARTLVKEFREYRYVCLCFFLILSFHFLLVRLQKLCLYICPTF